MKKNKLHESSKKKKICLISSSGGHFEQLLMLNKLSEKHNVFIVTEKTKYNKEDERISHFIPQVNRKELMFVPKMVIIGIKSIYILIKEKPDVVISTGVLATIPMIYLSHIFHKKTIYIESFAKINSPTQTGSLIYKKKLANQFYVQWETMKKYYPNAIYKGGIY